MGREEEVRVLIVEDDPATSEMYRLRLSADGYDVLTAADGEEGLRRAVADQPDLIYLDVRLPKLDGFEVLQRLRAEPTTSAIPVVILTNDSDAQVRERGLSLGALEFLVKSDTTPAALADAVGRHSEPGILS
ncbi:MAG TPA: response regulator [Candidatus Dormibacteraeota bacterium]|nr:response regulator [Candidatus Dormibacteraeota bacterium]